MFVIPEGFFGDPPTQQLIEGDSPPASEAWPARHGAQKPVGMTVILD